jgi:hypothetical protein
MDLLVHDIDFAVILLMHDRQDACAYVGLFISACIVYAFNADRKFLPKPHFQIKHSSFCDSDRSTACIYDST